MLESVTHIIDQSINATVLNESALPDKCRQSNKAVYSTPKNDIDTLKVIYSNVDSLQNKTNELEVYIQKEKPQIICLCEIFSKFSEKGLPRQIRSIAGYDLFLPDNQGGRGVCIYIHQSLKATRIDDLTIHPFQESVWCSIILQGTDRLLLGCVYRSPSSTAENNAELFKLMESAAGKHFSHKLIVGDFNFHEIKWKDNAVDASENHPASLFYDCTLDNFLHQHVMEPTRFRQGQREGLLDLVFTNEENMVDTNDIQIDQPLGNSDHAVLNFDFFCYLGDGDDDKFTPRFRFYKGNYEQLNYDLMNTDWDQLLEPDDINTVWNNFNSSVLASMHKHIPKTKPNSKFKDKPLWMDNEACRAILSKRRKWKKYRYCKSTVNYENYVAARNECTRVIRNSKVSYERKIATEAKTEPKSFWKYVKSKTKTKSGIGDLRNEDGELTSNNQEKANILNNFFSSVFTRTPNLPYDNLDSDLLNYDKSLGDIQFTSSQVLKKLGALNPGKSAGPDGMHPKVLQEIKEAIAEPLCKIFNKSLKDGKVPTDWKKAHISPIFKKGSKNEAGNYRPVSLTSVVCKIQESLIRDAIMEHMIRNELFSQHQYGFRPGRSCTTQLLEVLDDWSESLDNGDPVDVVYLDFSKAFDTVPHQRLEMKLYQHGIHGAVLRWITDFLSEREQCVVCKSAESDWRDVISGVPQGSVLGPVLFLVFINDLPDVVKGLVKIFADDTKLYGKAGNQVDHLQMQRDLDSLCDWSDKWKLRFNASKCKVMHLGHDNPCVSYYMNNQGSSVEIDAVTSEKDLGVTFQENLKFNSHIDSCVNKANRVLGCIRNTFDFLDKDMFLTLFKSLVRPTLEYATCVWSPYLKQDIRKIEKVQKRATKLVAECKDMTYEQRLRTLGIPTLEYRRERNDMLQVYKIMHGIDNVRRDQLFEMSVTSTRGHPFKLFKKQCRLNLRKYSFAHRVVDSWNELPDGVVCAETINAFKSALNQACWSRCKFNTTC